MNFQFLIEKLTESKEFQNFKKEFPDSYLCGGFFAIDRENIKNPDNKNQLDYYVPSTKKVYSFKIDGKIEKIEQETKDPRIPEKTKDNHSFDFDEIQEIIEEEMKVKSINNTIKKLILSFQSLNKKDYLIGTIFLNNLALLKVQFNLKDMKVEELEKKTLFDFLKKVK
jgi:hypothetical protein